MEQTKAEKRPISRLPDGRVNPDYTRWRKENILPKPVEEVGNAVAALQEQVADIPAPPTSILSLPVVKLPRNNAFVLCSFDGTTVPVRVRRGIGARLLKKRILVERLEDGTYIHRLK